MKIVTIVGARPQFVKAAALSRVIRAEIEEILVHTGQHYDANMSDVFFEELSIPMPNYNLGIGSGSHAKQTAEMMIGIETILIKEAPDAILVYGDTNSTLAGALAAVKLHIPIFHVEAGLRSFNLEMPEEINRILTDRISNVLFCPTEVAVGHLRKEGIVKNVFCVGDVMCDTVQFYGKEIDKKDKSYYLDRLVPLFERKTIEKWYLATIHRQDNTESIEKIREVLSAFEELDATVIFPVHPRIKKMVSELHKIYNYQNIYFCQPMGYMDMLYFTKHAQKVVTDSGGLQKEAYLLKTPCITVREQTEWVETLVGGWNILSKPTSIDIIDKIKQSNPKQDNHHDCYGDGMAAQKILKILLDYFRDN